MYDRLGCVYPKNKITATLLNSIDENTSLIPHVVNQPLAIHTAASGI